MKKYLSIAFLILTTHTVLAQLPADSIKAIIQREVANKRSKSIIVGIIDMNGRQIYSEGKLSDINPVLPDGNTMYEIGSITKVFTSLLLADMSLKKELDLSDPVSKFLPENVKSPKRNGKEISLLSLSTHRAGFPRNAYNLDAKDQDNPFADYTVSKLYEYISEFVLNRDIDSKWEYSNIGYSLLGHILSLVAKKEFETLVNERICKPLDMHSTVFSLTPTQKENKATGHSEYGRPVADMDFLLAGGGGLRSNVNDLLTFAAANLGLIKTDLFPAMELTHVMRAKQDGNDTYAAMGWTLANDDGKYILFKDGGTGGFRTFLGIDKKNKIGVVVLSNSNNSVTDIGKHILDPSFKVRPFKYQWALLDTLRAVIESKGVEAGIQFYWQLKASDDQAFIFNEHQLNYLGSELRRAKKIKDAISIYELSMTVHPNSTLSCENLAEIHRRNKNKKKALYYFEIALGMDPLNPRWTYMLNKLKSD